MINSAPLISVVLPVYNSENFIRDSVNSILEQSYKNIELIIINDGSTDSTFDIIKSFSDERIRIISRENKGLIFSLNEGISLAKGRFIARMDADDISEPDRIERQVKFLEKNKDINIVGASVYLIDVLGEKIGDLDYHLSPFWVKLRLLFDSCICHPSILARRDVFDEVRYDEDYQYAEDFKLWSEVVFNKNLNIQSLKNKCLQYRVHGNSISASKHENQLKISNKIIRENFASLNVKISSDLVRDAQLSYKMLKPMPLIRWALFVVSLIRQASLSNFKYIFFYILIITKCNIKGWFNAQVRSRHINFK
ncbi:glycosyltransferase [Aeromonas enteropelogenes]|uniref:glycosyltransferase n=1 Tax=Aeromonas enteropelogenes TaxID=29489 RepID=UPI00398A06F3